MKRTEKRPTTMPLACLKAPASVTVALSLALFAPASALAAPDDSAALTELETAGELYGTPEQGASLDEALLADDAILEDAGASARAVEDFTDCETGLWYAPYVDYVSERGYINGYEGTDLFGPYDLVTRGQLAAVLWRIAGEPEAASSTAGFPDLDADAFYHDAALWAQEEDIIEGRDVDGVRYFSGEDFVTRQESAKMLASFADYLGADTTTDYSALRTIQGWESAAGWALESLGWAADKGIIGGYDVNGVGYLLPDGNTERCALAKMITVLARDAVSDRLVLKMFKEEISSNDAYDNMTVHIMEANATWDRSFFFMAKLSMDFDEIQAGYRENPDFHVALMELASTYDVFSYRKYLTSVDGGANLDVVLGIYSADDEPVYATLNGDTELSLAYTLG